MRIGNIQSDARGNKPSHALIAELEAVRGDMYDTRDATKGPGDERF